MYILHIASELAPIAKVGGLGDVVYGLAKASLKSGNRVEVLIPKYSCLDYGKLSCLKPIYPDLWSFDGANSYHNTIWSATLSNEESCFPSILFLEPHHPNYLFSRKKIYGEPDDLDRFIYFSRAALEFLFKSGKRPDIIHLHDWPTAAAAPLYQELYAPLGFKESRIFLTIHNLEHQGICSPQTFAKSGLSEPSYLSSEKMQDPKAPYLLNLLKGGVEYSNFVTTVSPTYRKEILSPEGACGLYETLERNQTKIDGILNGIDSDYWNPSLDPLLPVRYSSKTVKTGKTANKEALQKRLGLDSIHRGPLVTAVSRLVEQKDPELIKTAILYTLNAGGQFVLIGSTFDLQTEETFHKLYHELKGNKNIFFSLQYNEELAHQSFAASDLIVIPSKHEPCGLTQLIALAYGTIPVVRKTGGLADTIFDIDDPSVDESKKNGFVFESSTPLELHNALFRAFSLYHNHPKQWSALIKKGMQQDHSWKKSAIQYQQLYESIRDFD